ncbi:fibulin-2 isoform X2 [Oncorhynchus tshawytscha]|uniref:Fibulin 2 n=1 Tax=Oncorhynchus tshawytscha TaxID=74940 RepID=A0A8C8CRH8_ONCTS|nr:fibulin-2 isoform X2 [Oncorhynchus tshawytscha]
MNQEKLMLFQCVLLLCLGTCLSQRDCTGVDCPVLDNCIEEVLEKDACCATCVKIGCSCEGYQYYDCIHAGFRNGKVPEGESYFVDFGSTECSCPQGGGRIGCHFIPCPQIPPNCITVVEPADGCPQCESIGCVRGNLKYEAGHSFQMDPCQVCHCPNDGGSLMCSPIPDCDPRHIKKPMLATTRQKNISLRDLSKPHDNEQTSPLNPLAPGNTLPLYKEDPPVLDEDKDYDYTLPDSSSTIPQDLVQPTESTTVSPSYAETSFPTYEIFNDLKQELRERLGTYDQETREEVTVTADPHHMDQTTSKAQGESTTSTTTTKQEVTSASHRHQQEVVDQNSRHHRDGDLVMKSDTSKDITQTVNSDKGVRHTGRHKHRDNQNSNHHDGSRSSQSYGWHHEKHLEEHLEEQREEPTKPQSKLDQDFLTMKFSPTSRAPVMREEGDQAARRQSQVLFNYQGPNEQSRNTEVSSKELVEICCETGEKWASANGHCRNMELPREDRHSICRTAQRQCCLGSLKESHCFSGMNAARKGTVCEVDNNDQCGADSYKECCSCCSLGLRFRSESYRCEAHQYLGYPCSHVFLTCCEGEKGEAGEDGKGGEGDGWDNLKERPALDPTAVPKRVSDTPFPKEAFSIREEEEQERENTVEGPPEMEDVDECQVYQSTLCHHRCINTSGSFRCACYPGYVLQQDAASCVPETVDEENRLREDDRPEVGSTSTAPPTTTTPVNPCEGNSHCMQQCSSVAGRPHCSCFPGFSLMADGQSCEDIDECVQGTHNCGPGFECVNSEGSFRCNAKPHCSMGFTQDTRGNCIDIDECGVVGRPCSHGFNCINTVGSYSCQMKIIMCNRGYHASPDGSRCIDVDECQSALHRCGEGQICHNLPGSYRCDCQTGYQYDMFRKMCVDVNECWRYPGRLCAQTCENTPGSYQCSCTAGFSLSSDGKNCEDVNECLTNPCSQECANIYGSYQCYCRQGYYLREDGHTCDDIDECAQSIGHLCSFKCVNVPGSYQCACPDYGYTMSPNGRACRDIDECTTGAHNCSLAETCYNIQGGFRCLSFDCPQNYRKSSDTRCERLSCPNFLDCQNSPLRITYYHLSFQTNIVIPAQIFRIGPSPAYSGDNVIISITQGNEDNYFSTRKLNAYTGAVYLHRQVHEPRDFLIDVEMKLWRQGTFTTFLARLYVFITANSL